MEKTSGQLERERRLRDSVIQIRDFTVCHHCKSTGLNENDKYCPNCAFPQRGTQVEMVLFLRSMKKKAELLLEQKKAVKKARNILYILAGINLLVGIAFGAIKTFDIGILLSTTIAAGIYFGLGLWSRTKPFPAILTGFFVYMVFLVVGIIEDPASILQGLLLKGIIIYGFIYGYKGVKDSEKLEKELASLKEAKNLSVENDMQ